MFLKKIYAEKWEDQCSMPLKTLLRISNQLII